MKNLYKILQEDDFEEMEVSELEKARVKSSLKKSIIQKEKRKSWKLKLVAAAMVCSLSVSAIGLAFPTYASNIPIIGDVFKFLDEETYGHYKEFSTEMNLNAESKGIKMTINEAIFDGNTVTVTYTIESKKALASNIAMLNHPPNIQGARGMVSNDVISKVDDKHYVGVSRFTPFELDLKEGEPINIDWKINHLILEEDGADIKGKWKFNFSLQATDSTVQLSDKFSEEEGVRVAIEEIMVTPMSFILQYDQIVSKQTEEKWTNIDVQLEVKDDLGNVYVGEGNGGFGKAPDTMTWSETFGKLDPNATKLIITPTINLVKAVENEQSFVNQDEASVNTTESRDFEESMNTTEWTTIMEKELTLEEIIIELEQ